MRLLVFACALASCLGEFFDVMLFRVFYDQVMRKIQETKEGIRTYLPVCTCSTKPVGWDSHKLFSNGVHVGLSSTLILNERGSPQWA